MRIRPFFHKWVTSLWMKIAIPILASIALLTASIFFVHLPHIYSSLLEKKKNNLEEMIQIIWSFVDYHYSLEKDGVMTRRQAQQMVLKNIEMIRFGLDRRDYFWVTDLTPKMILHPYVRSLNGRDLNDYKDPTGKRIFVEMVKKSEKKGNAFVSYHWQWKEVTDRVLPKISFVKRFEPWGWIIGSGVYLEDIRAESQVQARQLLLVSLAVLGAVVLLSLISIWQGVKAARIIREDEATLRAVFDQFQGFLGILDLKGNVLKVNRTALDFAGITHAEVIGRPFWETVWWKETSETVEKMRQTLKMAVQGGYVNFESQHCSAQGEEITMEVTVRPVLDPDEKPVFILLRGKNITERIRARRELEELNRTLEDRVAERTHELESSLKQLKDTQAHLVQSEKMASLGELVAGVSHEINTPLGLGVTNATYLQEQMDLIKASYAEGRFTKGEFETFLERAQEATASMLLNLTRGAEIIRSFKEVAVDQQVEERRKFNLKKYIEEVLLSLRPRYKSTRHQIDVACPADIILDNYPGVLMQILSNLVMNSFLHGFEGVEKGKILIQAEVKGDTLMLKYSDDGNGMTPEQKEKVYDPFYTTKQGQGGTGLGMHIVYNLVEQKLRGTISLDTALREGVLFTLRFPVIHPESEETREAQNGP